MKHGTKMMVHLLCLHAHIWFSAVVNENQTRPLNSMHLQTDHLRRKHMLGNKYVHKSDINFTYKIVLI